MPRVGFEPTIPVFELAKTFHALDGAATVISAVIIRRSNNKNDSNFRFMLKKITVHRMVLHEDHQWIELLGTLFKLDTIRTFSFTPLQQRYKYSKAGSFTSRLFHLCMTFDDAEDNTFKTNLW
jgi:hypothetical protein